MNLGGQRQTRIGILGAGQLGLMLSHSLSALGAEVHILEPNADSPATYQTPFVTHGRFDDVTALERFFKLCDRVTYEFEHIPTQSLRTVLSRPEFSNKLWPSLQILEISQNRIAEKRALMAADAPIAAWKEIASLSELEQEERDCRGKNNSFILKTATGGYDGKGQWRLENSNDWQSALDAMRTNPKLFPLVLEEKCKLKTEISVIVGRHPTRGVYSFPVFENLHSQGILDTTLIPARIDPLLAQEAEKVACNIAQKWNLHGLLCVEFFLVEKDNSTQLIVNEVAPRPHNSGHVTRRAMTKSQFDILAQILLDLPFHSEPIQQEKSWAMWNTLGDLWLSGQRSATHITWPAAILENKNVCETLLYGKKEARSGRKMGHIILTANDPEENLSTIATLRSHFNFSTPGGRT